MTRLLARLTQAGTETSSYIDIQTVVSYRLNGMRCSLFTMEQVERIDAILYINYIGLPSST